MLNSTLFANDPLLEQIAIDANGQRISTTQNREDPAVRKVQQALLIWDPDCLPVRGADGEYGSETAKAVLRFKMEVIGVQGTVYNDVGPLTVLNLDAIVLVHEQKLAPAARIAELDAWLTPALSGVFSSVSSSDVTVRVSGTEAFESLYRALSACVDERAVIVIAGWDFEPNTQLILGGTIADSLRNAASRGAQVRAIFNHFPTIQVPGYGEVPLPNTGNNVWAVDFINRLPGGAVIHDDKALHHSTESLGIPGPSFNIQLGVHHQKVWIVWTGDTLTAWCGGIDIKPNRVGPNAWHDVNVEVKGPAATHLYEVLRKRWNDNPRRPPNVSLPELTPPAVTGTHRCRIVTTFGNPSQFAGLNTAPYSFAPSGSKSIREMLFHCMGKARNFIYLEDQYFVDESIGRELASHLSHINALIINIPDTNGVNGEIHQGYARRRAAFNHFLSYTEKVAVVWNHKFVHSKLWIFDDTIALVSSANVNRRGFEHDSEIGVAFGAIQSVGTVREMRERLWAMHLGPNMPVSGTDPAAALSLWKAPPPGSHVSVYDWTNGADVSPVPLPLSLFMGPNEFWEIVDPRCP